MLTEEIRAEVIELFSNVGVETGFEDASFVQDELDSLQFISLVCDLEEKYGISFSDGEIVLDENETMGELIEMITDKICKAGREE